MLLEIDEAISELSPLIQSDKLIAFVGSGVSKFSGLPTWDEFLQEFVAFCESEANSHHSLPELNMLFNDARTNPRNNPVHTATVLKESLLKLEQTSESNIQDNLRDWFVNFFMGKEPSNCHKLIVESAFPVILTTNYDNLLELAAKDSSHSSLASRSYSFKSEDRGKLASAIYNKKDCIVHIHGKAIGIVLDEIVLTAEDYIKMIKRKHQGFTFVIQQLFFNYSTLFLGYGASDPHLEDLVEEVAFFLNYPNSLDLPKSYLVATRDRAGAIFERYKQKMRTEIIVIDDYSQYEYLLAELKNQKARS